MILFVYYITIKLENNMLTVITCREKKINKLKKQCFNHSFLHGKKIKSDFPQNLTFSKVKS